MVYVRAKLKNNLSLRGRDRRGGGWKPPSPGCEMGSKDPAFFRVKCLLTWQFDFLYNALPINPSPSILRTSLQQVKIHVVFASFSENLFYKAEVCYVSITEKTKKQHIISLSGTEEILISPKVKKPHNFWLKLSKQ